MSSTPSSFSDFNLSPELMQALQEMGFTEPTPIQALSIPVILEGQDVMAQAQTGTGKTAAFGLPALHLIQEENKPGIQMLILTPTRELAQQVGLEIQKLGKYVKLPVATIIGGKSYSSQRESLKRARILIATPGRLTDLLESGSIPNFAPRFLVLDEADRMLDMGFADDLEKIVAALPAERQTLLFSATFATAIRKLAQNIQKSDRKTIKVEASTETNPDIEQFAYVVKDEEKDDALYRLIDFQKPKKTIIFCEMKRDADRLGIQLNRKGYKAQILHGDTEQRKREEIMAHFRRQKEGILVATDLAGRGLDVSDISHVINFQIPYSRDSYIHRIGRTGRAGAKGVAVNLVTMRELRIVQKWAEYNKAQIKVQGVPTLTQLRRQAITELKNKLETIEPSMMALESLTSLAEGSDVDQLAIRLLELYLKNLSFHGPEKLGWSEEDLQKSSMAKRSFSRPPAHAGRGGGGENRGRFSRRSNEGGEHRRDRSGSSERRYSARGESSERGERSEYRSERSERPARAERSAYSARSERPARSERSRSEGSERSRSDKSGSGRSDRRGSEGRTPTRRYVGQSSRHASRSGL